YEEVFRESMQFEYPVSNTTREELKRFQRILELNDAETSAIEAIIIQSSSEAEYRKEEETITQEPPIQQSSPAQPTQPPQEPITRQTFLKWAGLGSVGLVTAVAGLEFFKGQSPKYIPVKFETIKFTTLTTDKKGQIIKQDPNKQAKFFKEDLGNGITLDMIEIPGGSFNMGSPFGENGRTQSEEPQHAVNVPAFFMGKFEVTQEQYQQIMGSNPSRFEGAKRPVERVSWDYAVEFCRKLSQKTGREYRLPSEAEWEYACRAGTTTPFHFGETITTELANYNGNYTYASAPKGKYRQETTEVGSFSPNAFGLYDMHGNVWEWCKDIWHDNYKRAPTDASAWKSNDNPYKMLLRGGSWFDNPSYCRSASRSHPFRAERDDFNRDIGFRVVCGVGVLLSSSLYFSSFTLYPSFLYPF
ncbi:formylglycine-generating enzyme family protein, partial [Nostoc sp.]